MDEVQRHARQELDGFAEAVSHTAAESNRQFAASREEARKTIDCRAGKLLQRFQAGMAAALDNGVREAQEKINHGFVPLWESWKAMTSAAAGIARLDSGAEQRRDRRVKTRLDNVSNTWLLTTVAKLDHQSRDVVTGLSASAKRNCVPRALMYFQMSESRCAGGCRKLLRIFEVVFG